jgi:hypothetical protein|tara:strand:- start:553 stop:1167 length:615 start_codon:yes stop_codon:yes gene_type:complete
MNPIKYDQAKELIKEGDILLFRGSGTIGFLIKRYTGGVHSHVALAHKDGDVLECVEFREFMGGRSVSLKSQVDNSPLNIDVFRPVKSISYEEMDAEGNTKLIEKNYTEETASAMTEDIIRWTGQPYGWSNIWKMFLRFIPGARLFQQNINDDEVAKAKVCSTAVTVALRRNFMDPVPYLADDRVSPADLARSPILQYLFTIDGR